ncbi:MAG: FG-GAP repeat protein, partial [Acidimicrobiales bacterium]
MSGAVVPTREVALLVATALWSVGLTATGAAGAGAVDHQVTAPLGRQLAELAGPDGRGYDWFGSSVAVSGSTIVVGAPAVADASSGIGRAYVFTRTATGWHESGELAGSGSIAHDWFGDAVAISGSTIVVGAPSVSVLTPGLGRAYVFT